jgi:hypothetical protein
MISPRFSNVDGASNPFEQNPTIQNDPIITYGNIPGHYHAINFMRKQRGFLGKITYKAVPNLLQNSDQGYMYPIFYYTRQSIPTVGTIFYLNIGFVYLHPDYANKIKERLIETITNNSDNLLKGKGILWW